MCNAVELNGRDLVGARVTGVVSSVYVDGSTGDRSLVHVWLMLDGKPVLFHTMSGVRILRSDIEKPYEMAELGGRVVVEESAGEPWDALVGRTITGVARLCPDLGEDGWLLRASGYQMAVMDLGDELVARLWPDASWGNLAVVELF
ncbi:hypothetical protein [Luteipulveratus mongoliensis]|uniref:hypothetical protein n=1 Tax=Luteipulveratus mongoliensis TaxID=571913 RepID=UPI0012ED6DC4|nr:hypothetical protein [Luteipulveratus mongoliensis]